MTTAPDPYTTRGWTIQHQHRTTAEPPYLDLSEPEDAAAEPQPDKAPRKPRKRA